MIPEKPADGLAPGFFRFWWGEAVSGFGDAITSLAFQTLVVVTLQGSAVQVGWLNSARWLPYLVLGLVVGALVDRARRRPLMMATDLSRAALLTLIPLAWVLDLLSFPLLLIVVVMFGTASLINDAASCPSCRALSCSVRMLGSMAPARWRRPQVRRLLVPLSGS